MIEEYKLINEIFGEPAVSKIKEIIYKLQLKIETLEKSRDNWRQKYEELKKIKEKINISD
jgi:chaperonin cofactor prefoldin